MRTEKVPQGPSPELFPQQPPVIDEDAVRNFMKEHNVMNRKDVTIVDGQYRVKDLTPEAWDALFEDNDSQPYNGNRRDD